MKRLDLVQLAIIIVGVFIAYFFVISLPQLLFLIYSWFEDGTRGGYYMENMLSNVIVILFYFLSAFYCIKKSKHFAEWICYKANLEAEINFRLDKTELLFVLFVGLGVYGLVTNLPGLLVAAFNKVKTSNSFEEIGTRAASNSDIDIKLVTIFLYFVLVYYAKVFADLLAARINNKEPEDTIAEKTE